MTAQEKNLIFHSSIGDIVRAWRKARNLTLVELAQRCGSTITKGYLSQVENNRIDQPNDDHLLRIAKALEIPVEYLVIRRLPNEQDTQTEIETHTNPQQPDSAFSQPNEQSPSLEEGGFAFGSPIPSPRRGEPNEEEELLQILAELDELRSRVKKLIARKRKRR